MTKNLVDNEFMPIVATSNVTLHAVVLSAPAVVYNSPSNNHYKNTELTTRGLLFTYYTTTAVSSFPILCIASAMRLNWFGRAFLSPLAYCESWSRLIPDTRLMEVSEI